MNKTTKTATLTETFILAGRNDNGVWQEIEAASREADETAEDVKMFLQTMAHANSRNYVEMEIMTETEFARRVERRGPAAA